VPACAEIVISAAYIHDLVPRRPGKDFSTAASQSALATRELLSPLGFSDDAIRGIEICVSSASWEHAVKGGQPSGVEAYLLRDADLLEAVGAHGIARVFAFAGAMKRPLIWLQVDLSDPPHFAANISGPDPGPFHHFYAKLLWLERFFYTNAAKDEAKRRRQTLLEFLEHYERENQWAF
jgi:uncharacterized protein